ncbi:MAG: hypothetical protein IPM92_09550 [Saprospiraceae bacterium]|nr:hypothetical protein [Saprospiraceae bacterium]
MNINSKPILNPPMYYYKWNEKDKGYTKLNSKGLSKVKEGKKKKLTTNQIMTSLNCFDHFEFICSQVANSPSGCKATGIGKYSKSCKDVCNCPPYPGKIPDLKELIEKVKL